MKIPNPPTREPIAQSDGGLRLQWVMFFSQLFDYFSSIPRSNEALPNFVNDAAAAAGGVPINGYYRNGSIVMQRIV
jgi:hypothetical protein